MNKKCITAFVFAFLLMFFSTSASAITMDVSWTGLKEVTFQYDSVLGSDYDKTSSYATEFKITLDGGVWDDFETIGYCVDLDGELNNILYDPVYLDDISATNYLHAAWLMDKYADDASGDKEKEAGLQLAIWNAVYENNITIDSSQSGNISNYFNTYNQAAESHDDMLAALGYTYQIVTFTDGIQSYADTDLQEILIRTNPVPEPATMVLFGIGLLGLGALGRKKQI